MTLRSRAACADCAYTTLRAHRVCRLSVHCSLRLRHLVLQLSHDLTSLPSLHPPLPTISLPSPYDLPTISLPTHTTSLPSRSLNEHLVQLSLSRAVSRREWKCAARLTLGWLLNHFFFVALMLARHATDTASSSWGESLH